MRTWETFARLKSIKGKNKEKGRQNLTPANPDRRLDNPSFAYVYILF